jgi:phage gpG-like protein
MAAVKDIMLMVEFIKTTESSVKRAAAKAQLRTGLAAQRRAKMNAKRQFIGRHGRRLSGQLLNAIYTEIQGTKDIPDVVLGVRNIPYGAIHEFGSEGLPGGVIRPVNARKLWIPNHRRVGKMTPREFIQQLRRNPRDYMLTPKIAGKRTKSGKVTPLFYLKDKVKIPARPYLTPAVMVEFLNWPGRFIKHLGEELD